MEQPTCDSVAKFADLVSAFDVELYLTDIATVECYFPVTADEQAGIDRANDHARVRFGPIPNPESLTAIRAVIRDAVGNNAPIPILMPWGSKKPNNARSVDLAEVMALKSLSCAVERIRKHYAPGVDMVIRVEDLSGWVLFAEEGEQARKASDQYVADFTALLKTFDIPGVEGWLESEHIKSEEGYRKVVLDVEPLFARYLAECPGTAGDENHPAMRLLRDCGWQGIIPASQRQFYYDRSERANPGISMQEKQRQLAHYFATVLARTLAIVDRAAGSGYGNRASWGKSFIGMSFHPPIPDGRLVDRRVYYRTLPENYAKTHIPPWRARGYLRINGRQACPKLATWGEAITPATIPLTLDGNGARVTVQAEYIEV